MGSRTSHGNYGGNSSSQNSWLGGNGGAPPSSHFMSYAWGSVSGIATGPPLCGSTAALLNFCDGDCLKNNNAPVGGGQLIPTGQMWDITPGWSFGPWILSNAYSNPSYCTGANGLDMEIEFQVQDAAGIGVEVDPSAFTNWTHLALSPNSNMNSTFGAPGFTDSFIYKISFGAGMQQQVMAGGTATVLYMLQAGTYTTNVFSAKCDCLHASGVGSGFHPIEISSGNPIPNSHTSTFTLTYTGWNGAGWSGCGPQPIEYLCLGTEVFLDSMGGCVKIYDPTITQAPVGGGITKRDAMKALWRIGENIWLARDDFGYTMSRDMAQAQDPGGNVAGPTSTPAYPNGPFPDGATFTEPYQGVNLTSGTGQPLVGLNPFPGGNSFISLQNYINVLALGTASGGYQLPEMPANPSNNNWTQGDFPFGSSGFLPGYTPPHLPTGGVNTYNQVAPGMTWTPVTVFFPIPSTYNTNTGSGPNTVNMTWVNNWNPSPGQFPGANMAGGMNYYKGVFDINIISQLAAIPPPGNITVGSPNWGGPYTNQPVVTNPTGINNPIRVWQPLHDTLSSCLACCGDRDIQFDQNGNPNPYYASYVTPYGWDGPLQVPSNNQGFEDFLNGQGNSPLPGVTLPRINGMLKLYQKIKGHHGCGARWIE